MRGCVCKALGPETESEFFEDAFLVSVLVLLCRSPSPKPQPYNAEFQHQKPKPCTQESSPTQQSRKGPPDQAQHGRILQPGLAVSHLDPHADRLLPPGCLPDRKDLDKVRANASFVERASRVSFSRRGWTQGRTIHLCLATWGT